MFVKNKAKVSSTVGIKLYCARSCECWHTAVTVR